MVVNGKNVRTRDTIQENIIAISNPLTTPEATNVKTNICSEKY